LPRVGPVIISEIMYAPLEGTAQFVELANLTNISVPLYDPAHPTNVWKIEGLGNFAFPTNTEISPCSTIIVCSTNPVAFRDQYAVSASVPVFGPWSGRLDPDGETIKLLRPGNPEPDGAVPYYRVDHVSYRSRAPWPQASSGVSLEKLPIEAYGNDPAYWRLNVANGTPGVPSSNRPPAIVIAGAQTVDELTPMTLSVTAVDLDFPWQSVSLAPTELPPGSTFDAATGTFQWTPSAAQGPGAYTLSFSVEDSASCNVGRATASISLIVNDVNKLVLSIQPQQDSIRIRFPATAGGIYWVEFSDSLFVPNWQVLQEITGGQTGIIEIIDSRIGAATDRFYRIRGALPP